MSKPHSSTSQGRRGTHQESIEVPIDESSVMEESNLEEKGTSDEIKTAEQIAGLYVSYLTRPELVSAAAQVVFDLRERIAFLRTRYSPDLSDLVIDPIAYPYERKKIVDEIIPRLNKVCILEHLGDFFNLASDSSAIYVTDAEVLELISSIQR